MDVCLLYRDSHTDGKKPYHTHRDIIKDLNLDIVFKTMSRGDFLIDEKVRRVMMIPLTTPEEIRYRQDIINDFYEHTGMLNELYSLAEKQYTALRTYKEETAKGRNRSSNNAAETIVTIKYLKQAQESLGKLRTILRVNEGIYASEGLKSLLARLDTLSLEQINIKIQEMEAFLAGASMGYTFQFGGGLKIKDAVLNSCNLDPVRGKKPKQSTFQNLYLKYIKKNTLFISNDDVLKQDVLHLRQATVAQMLRIFKPYLQQLISFFEHYIEEIAFYMGVIKFMRRLSELNIPLKVPTPLPMGSKDTSFTELYELSMAIYSQTKPVGNYLNVKDNLLTLITGANQGGKSTFLRSYGIAQVLMQCGMPVPAIWFTAPIYSQIFTHFTRQEDEQLSSGRLREELKRMSSMIDIADSHSLFLFNESFASTTEKEGAKIAYVILKAFYEKNIQTMMVTHLHQLADDLYNKQLPGITFLVAERLDDGSRTFHMIPGKPSHTSFGTDLFKILEDEIYV
ncbi:MAG: hypothetical protein IJV71_10360 [Lachnospiraceae bacterium]|nr:hypothetical protein [Lachnospiraceae bacterium]